MIYFTSWVSKVFNAFREPEKLKNIYYTAILVVQMIICKHITCNIYDLHGKLTTLEILPS